ncbi:MAG: response regulator transcription factor [Acidobacteriia bacterium]|nr:response regulator transcription factor [Terriglobia bacterium]
MDRTPPAVRILIADDHQIYRIGLRRVFESEAGFQVVGEAADGEQAIRLAKQLKPEILLLDLAMPRRTGLEALRELSAAAIPMRVIVLTAAIEPPQVVEALQLGARGIVLKSVGAAQMLIKSVRAVMAGQYWVGHESVSDLVKTLRDLMPQVAEGARKKTFGLTSRELEIVGKIVLGCTNKDIAHEASITEDTVKRHLTNIFDKTGVSNRLELALFALKHQLVGDL